MSPGSEESHQVVNSRCSKAGRACVLVVGLSGLAAAAEPAERRADVAVRFVLTDYGQFDEKDMGVGVDLSYRFADWLAADAQLSLFPDELGEPASFSDSRIEGLFGLRAGHRFGGAGVYGAVRPGFVKFSEPSEPRPCILIFPPPLECTLAGGTSVFALNYGVGLEAFPGDRAVFRVEVGDLMLRYPGPVLADNMAVLDDHLWRHNLRATASVGIRF
jgi:hypothetical protein